MGHHEQTVELSPFTYFKDVDGFIYYASGDNSLKNDAVRSVLVYSPTEDSGSARFQPASETAYAKSVSHGYRSELPRLQASLPPDQYRVIAGMFESDSNNGDEFLAVPSERVIEVYDPKKALTQLIDGANPIYSSAAVARAREAVNVFQNKGLYLGRLGLYGGLQCSLVHTDGKEINDIDLLVDGLSAYADIVDLSSSNVVRPETFPEFIASNAIKRAVALRRGQLSQFRLWQHPDTVVDIRLVRAGQDNRETAKLLSDLRPTEAITISNGTVTQAYESLSVPARFEVQDTEGTAWSVVTNQYHHLGAATNGDVVSVHGGIIGDNIIALSDPNRHHIYMPEVS